MKVCIAEKPSVAGEIAKVIGANNRENGYYSGNGYCVTWTFGHLCELKEPQDYDPVYKRWDFSLLPILPAHFGIRLKGDSGIKKQFNTISQLFSNAECIINCGDAGQEGELIQRWVMQMAGAKCPVYRLWISSLTEESIREGFANLRPGQEFDSLYHAGSARAIGDWLLGMNATRAYTIRYGGRGMVLSIGRVQTPTLALIVQRYKEIVDFKPTKYWELKTKYRDVLFSAASGRFATIEEGQKALEAVQGHDFRIDDVQSKQGKESAPPLYDLTSLQVECNNKFAMSADDTLRIAQSLYENKFTTYPRVDTKFLTDDIYTKVPSILRGLSPYANLVDPLLAMGKLPKSKKVFNNLKVTDHHAIIPTGVPPRPSMTPQEKKVYDLIARRFIANFYPESKVALTTVLGSAANVKFKVNGKQIVEPGWRVVYGGQKMEDEAKEDNAVLPVFVIGESGTHEPSLQEKQTQPPKPYTEATLLRAMETAGKQVDNDELRDLMKENGIGRPSTRAAIIETLFRRNYIVKEKKNLQPTINGVRLIDTISSPMLKSVELTGLWEKKLREIEGGAFSAKQFIDEMRQMVGEVVTTVFNDNVSARFAPLPDVSVAKAKGGKSGNGNKSEAKSSVSSDVAAKEMLCPKCGKPMLKGRAAWGCSGYKEGCNLVVPFEVMGKKLTENQVAVLLTKGETPQIKGLLVEGEKQNGRLAFDGSFGIVFRSAEPKKTSIDKFTCPLCGGAILEGRTGWGCANYRNGCRFVVPYVFLGKKLTATHLGVLTKKRATGVISGFVDQNGIHREGILKVDDNGTVSLQENLQGN